MHVLNNKKSRSDIFRTHFNDLRHKFVRQYSFRRCGRRYRQHSLSDIHLHLNPLAMLIKSSTNLTSAVQTVLHNHKGSRQAIFIAAIVAALMLWKLYTGLSQATHADACVPPAQTGTSDEKMAGMKWSYDELAHKLIIENTDLAYAEIGEGFSKGIGRVLNKVTRQGVARNNAGKRVVVNL